MFTRADWIVIVAAVALLPLLYHLTWQGARRADQVEIQVQDQAPIRLPLSRNTRITVNGYLGPATVEVRNRQARFVDSTCDASCTSKRCVQSGWHSRPGAFTACLPNRVSLTIVGDNPQYDAINH